MPDNQTIEALAREAVVAWAGEATAYPGEEDCREGAMNLFDRMKKAMGRSGIKEIRGLRAT